MVTHRQETGKLKPKRSGVRSGDRSRLRLLSLEKIFYN